MSTKLPFKKNYLVFGIFLLAFFVLFGSLAYLAASASASTKSKIIAREEQSRSVKQTTLLLARLKDCANEHKSQKFDQIHTEFAVKLYDNPHSIDVADVQPALIECNRLAYK